MTNEMAHWQRYHFAARRVQTGVAQEMAMKGEEKPKFLRVGINSTFAQQAGLAKLLIEKGVFTNEEYAKAMADAMEDEVKRYEELLSNAMGAKVTLEPCGPPIAYDGMGD